MGSSDLDVLINPNRKPCFRSIVKTHLGTFLWSSDRNEGITFLQSQFTVFCTRPAARHSMVSGDDQLCQWLSQGIRRRGLKFIGALSTAWTPNSSVWASHARSRSTQTGSQAFNEDGAAFLAQSMQY